MVSGQNRRVSYVVPAPTVPVPKLSLPPLDTPRNGQIGPLIVYPNGHVASVSSSANRSMNVPSHPRHRLPVSALALDTSTQRVGHASAEGILYTGGRDGMVIGWDLGLPMKMSAREREHQTPSFPSRWERLTGWSDDSSDEDDEEDYATSDGDVLGYSQNNTRRGSSSKTDIEQLRPWELDINSFESGHPSVYRTSTQAHSDWVNEILLCNSNQTVVSGSNDGSIKAWNPHSATPSFPTTIGTHSDYVRCLARSRAHNWLASGSFDRTIKLWDLSEARKSPLMTFLPPESPGPKSSVYAMATDAMGKVLASGGPERVIRTWDPRTGKRIGKLVGHTDNIRAILISEDARYLLTGSADASIKLWSLLSPQRCLHTFTHHTESVWSLFSTHPNLEVFYSGDRSGLVCRVDVDDGRESDSLDVNSCDSRGAWRVDRVADGECFLICRDEGDSGLGMPASEGVNKIVALDDSLVWTATGSSSVKRWHVPPARTTRMKAGMNTSWSASPTQPSKNTLEDRQDADVPYANSSSPPPPLKHTRSLSPPVPDASASKRILRHSNTPSITASFISNNSSFVHEHEGADTDATTDAFLGIPYESLIRLSSPDDPFPQFVGANHSGNRDAEVATLYSAASVMSVPRQTRSPSTPTFPTHGRTLSPDSLLIPGAEALGGRAHMARDAFEQRDVAGDAVPLVKLPDEIVAGTRGLVRVTILNDRIHALTVDTAGEVAVWDIVRCLCLGIYTKEEVTNASTASGGKRGGSLSGASTPVAGGTERHSPRQALETVRERIEGEAVVLQWVAADTKIGELTIQIMDRWYEAEIFADEAGYGNEWSFSDEHRLNIGKWVLKNLFNGFIREQTRIATRERERQLALKDAQLNVNIPTPAHVRSVTEGAVPSSTQDDPLLSPRIHAQSSVASTSTTTTPGPLSTSSTATATPSQDYFSLRRRASVAGQETPDDFSGWAGPGSKSHTQDGLQSPSTPGVGFMGKLRNLGMGKNPVRKATTETETSTIAPSSTAAESEQTEITAEPVSISPPTFVEQLRSQGITPPTPNEAPPLSIPSHVSICISEESKSGWTPIYRGTVGSVASDVLELERAMPDWLLELLLSNKSPTFTAPKIGFVLLPAPTSTGEEQLPELLNTSQSKLSASRFLRVRKLCYHVQEKLDKNPLSSKPSTPTPVTPSNTGGAGTSGTSTARPSTSASTSSAAKASATPPGTPHRPATSSGSAGSDGSGSSASAFIPYPPGIPQPQPQVLPKAEEVYEILCNEQVLPLDMTLAAVRQFVWRQAAELVMHYRRKQVTAGVVGTSKIR